MTDHLHLSTRHRTVIETLLRAHLPEVEAWAYGSRVNGRCHDGSDLDLVLRGLGLKEIPADQLRDFREAVGESGIPFLVEARDWARLPEGFRREIERGYVALVGRDQNRPGARMGWRQLLFSDAVVINPSVRLERGRKYPFVDMSAVSAGSRPAYALQSREFKGGGSRFQNGDTLMARITPCLENGKIGRYCESVAEGGAHGSTEFIVIRGRSGTTDTEYAYYLTRWEEVHNFAVGQMTGTSGRQRVPVESFDHLMVPIPPLSEQRAIAHILGTLDDKIELNRRMNETLEAMARALFKSWFIDFDPVRAKAALRAHATKRAHVPITPPLRGSRGGKGASPKATRWGNATAPQPPPPWPDIKRQYDSKALHHAQAMRGKQTSAEGLLWYYLRKKQLGGYKFRRQQPIGPYTADFACLPQKLLIELNGGQHADPKAPVEQRDQFLRQEGYRVLRFQNQEVFADCLGVLERVYEAVTDPPPPQPATDGPASATPPQGGSDWNVERARAYLSRMDPDIAALFPDSFVDSELGEIPEGWRIGTVNQLAEKIQNGGTPKRSEARYWNPGEIPWLTSGELRQSLVVTTQQFISKVGLAKSSAKILPAGSVLVALYGGTTGQVSMNYQPLSTNQAVCSIIPRIGNRYFCLMGLREKISYFRDRAVGSAQQNISKKIVEDTTILLPQIAVRSAYDAMVESLFDRKFRNLDENQALLALRNTVLPDLISGKRLISH